MSVYVLGTGLSHNGSAVLLKDGYVEVGIEKERLSRIKHDGGNDFQAVQYCLDAAGISVNDLTLVVQCANFEKQDIGLQHYRGARVFPEKFHVPVVSISHHLAHAFSAIGTAPFDEGNVFVLDGCGSPAVQCDDLRACVNLCKEQMEGGSGLLYCEKDSLYRFEGNSFQPLMKDFSEIEFSDSSFMRLPTTKHSIGGLYAAASAYCFGNMDDAGKLMGLAPYGKRGRFSIPLFLKQSGRVFLHEEGLKVFERPAADYDAFRKDFAYYADVAWWVQQQVEDAVLYTLQQRISSYRIEQLCYTGGVALNAMVNARISREFGLKVLHIEPAAGDNGLALGGAFYGWLQLLKKEKTPHNQGTCFGKTYSPSRILSAISRFERSIQLQKPADITGSVASLLHEGKQIAWFQSGSEFGPRALGHRSILSSPFVPGVRDYINREIKKREDFRPFAPAILAEDVARYYVHQEHSPYMLLVNTVKKEYEEMLQAVVHSNGTSRTQTVAAGDHPLFHELLHKFKELSGHGILLNTSFNKRGMPIVETPEDAIAFFMESPLDVLVLEDQLILKMETEEDALLSQIVSFIRSIEIQVSFANVEEKTFLPGILVRKGEMVIDRAKLKYPGDLLHEAGHLAVTPAYRRNEASGNLSKRLSRQEADGEEMMAIAWSYAAVSHLSIDPSVVFHSQGYKGASDWYISNYTSGNYLWLPLLQWAGLTYDEEQAMTHATEPYPRMLKWLRD